jgi:acyl-CoA thioesterase
MSIVGGLPDTEFGRGLAMIECPGRPGVYGTELAERWRLGGAVHGGFLLALAARALSSVLPGHPDPLSISAYYLSAAQPGPAVLHAEVIRRGRTLSHGSVSLGQEGEHGPIERMRVTAAHHDLAAAGNNVRYSAPPPAMPPPERCPVMPRYLDRADILDLLDFRLDPATSGWVDGRPSGQGVLRGWLRMTDGHDPDPLLLLMAVDVLPPVTRELGVEGYVPTIELTAHVRAKPVPGWLCVAHTTRNYAGGYLEEDAEIWDSSGRLVAQSRQLARPVAG